MLAGLWKWVLAVDTNASLWSGTLVGRHWVYCLRTGVFNDSAASSMSLTNVVPGFLQLRLGEWRVFTQGHIYIKIDESFNWNISKFKGDFMCRGKGPLLCELTVVSLPFGMLKGLSYPHRKVFTSCLLCFFLLYTFSLESPWHLF